MSYEKVENDIAVPVKGAGSDGEASTFLKNHHPEPDGNRTDLKVIVV